MTNTNNQEWWVEEWRDQFAESGVDYGEDADELAEEWNQKQIAFIRKVSQQSREDAFREVYEEFGKEWGQKVDEGTTATAYLVCLDTVRAILKSKLPPKQ